MSSILRARQRGVGDGRPGQPGERDWVREAPRFKPDESLSAGNELVLCAHWGIRKDQDRAVELKGIDPDEVTAVLAEQ